MKILLYSSVTCPSLVLMAQIFSNISGWGHSPPHSAVNGPSCCHWAVHIVDRLFVSLVGGSCCCFTGPCILFGPPGVMSPALLLFGPFGYHFTHPAVVWAIWLSLYPPCLFYSCCRVPPGRFCAVIASWPLLHCCGHPGCTFITILVALLLLSLLRCCRYPSCVIVVVLVVSIVAQKCWCWKEGGKWGWWKTRKGRKQVTTKIVACFCDALCGPSTFLGPPFGYSSPSTLSFIEWAHIPPERGGAPVGLSLAVGRELGW